MTAIVEIDGFTFAPARITAADVLTMTRAGTLPEERGHELIDGVLVGSAMRGSGCTGMPTTVKAAMGM